MTASPASIASGTGASAPVRAAVPWRTLLPLAVLLAYVDGFWMVSLRGAVGAIERTQEPFASWLRESTAILPVFVLAVLAAITLALRWFGPALSGKMAFLTTALLIATAATVAGTASLAASEVWDYALQRDLMGSLHHASSVQSVQQLDQASLGLQLAALAYGTGLLLVTNIVVTGWTVAMRGGRLDVSQSRKRPVRHDGTGGTNLWQMLAAVALFGSAAIHIAVIPEHQDHWAAAGVFFLVLALAELAGGVLVLRRPGPNVLRAVAAASAVPLAVWLWSRTAGLPFGPEAGVPEAVGLADAAACVLELGTLVAAAALLRTRGRLTARPVGRAHLRALAVVAAIAVGTLGLAAAVPGWYSNVGTPADTVHSDSH